MGYLLWVHWKKVIYVITRLEWISKKYNHVTCLPWGSVSCNFHEFQHMFITKPVMELPGQLQFNTLRQRQNGCHFTDDIFKPIFLNENIRILIEISLKFVSKVPVNNIPALVQIMAWHRPGNKPLSEPTMVCLLTHICITRPQWVKDYTSSDQTRYV